MTSNSKFIVLGIFMGISISCLGVWLYINFFVSHDIIQYISISYQEKILNKIISLGSLPSLGLFFLLLSKKQGAFSKGILISVFINALGVLWLTIE